MENKPLSKEFLLSRGSCCGNGCKNCPWKDKDFMEALERKNNLRTGYTSRQINEVFIKTIKLNNEER